MTEVKRTIQLPLVTQDGAEFFIEFRNDGSAIFVMSDVIGSDRGVRLSSAVADALIHQSEDIGFIAEDVYRSYKNPLGAPECFNSHSCNLSNPRSCKFFGKCQ